ncbi:MAG: TRL-like family protein [Desulfobacterota bacterium]|nr:TRL-like family protein [Thermodesulfobacteriota bacterium]
MKKLIALVLMIGFLSGACASYLPMGVIYTKVDAPVAAGEGPVKYSKVGKAEAQSILGLVALGDASIQTAARNADIKTIKYVDYHVENILGIIGRYTTTVYGD